MRSSFSGVILLRGQSGRSFGSIRMKFVFVSSFHFLTKTFSPTESSSVRKSDGDLEIKPSEAVQESSPFLAALLALTVRQWIS